MNGLSQASGTCTDSRQQALASVQDIAMLCVVSMARMRDQATADHILRTQHYVRALAVRLRQHPRFRRTLDCEMALDLLCRAAVLHDIGKVAIPDQILLKPGRLTAAEFAQMQQHTVLGCRALENIEELADRELGQHGAQFLRFAREIVLSHHERWDGQGYPQGLSGDAIPCAARIMAVADVYDALISRRPYKDGLPHEEAAACILEGRDSQFDPAVVDAFAALQQDFVEIAGQLAERYPQRAAGAAL